MPRTRFDALTLRYGCHDGHWAFPAGDRPVVLAGPNGSGKSTLVDGLIRTLFGFDRRRSEDGAELDARTPWAGRTMKGRLVLTRDGEAFQIERDFDSDRVRVWSEERNAERFAGDGNPAARNQEAAQYREILTDLLGLSELTTYRRTLLVGQGELPGTSLADQLVHVAAGGHARVGGAQRQIGDAHRALTRRPLDRGGRAATHPRELERLEEELNGTRERLADSRAAAERRRPLVRERERLRARLADLGARIRRLEDALQPLGRFETIELATRHLRHQVAGLADAGKELDRAEEEHATAVLASSRALEPGRYPDDFAERLARSGARWQDRRALEGTPSVPLAVLAGAILLAAAGLLAAGLPVPAGIAAAAGALASLGWGGVRLWVRRRRLSLDRELAGLLDGVPSADTLGPDTAGAALAAFRAQQAAETGLRAARNRLAAAVRGARTGLRAAGLAGPSPAPGSEGRGDGDGSLRRLAERLERAAESLREDLARYRIERDKIGDVAGSLPEGVEPTSEGVRNALVHVREERTAAEDEHRDVSRELIERGTPAESVDALERRCQELAARREALKHRVEVLEAAHALVADAYRAFRERDQGRLTERVSRHVERLTGGRVSGIRVDGDLDDARALAAGRAVPMASPPLSFGELHALQLGVRLGAADFLAGLGVLPPLIVDEPFAHLDEDAGRAVWNQLARVAETRQVIVTTQDTRRLAELGVVPDIRLG